MITADGKFGGHRHFKTPDVFLPAKFEESYMSTKERASRVEMNLTGLITFKATFRFKISAKMKDRKTGRKKNSMKRSRKNGYQAQYMRKPKCRFQLSIPAFCCTVTCVVPTQVAVSTRLCLSIEISTGDTLQDS